jgi:hypothetical protein
MKPHHLYFYASALALAALPVAAQDSRQWTYLSGVTVGEDSRPVELCEPGDPLGIADNQDIASAIRYLAIDPDDIRFNGCPRGEFAVGLDPLRADGRGYLIMYPVDVGDRFVAPVTHELAHVLQIQVAGSMSILQAQNSKRIELGADFITGIVFHALFESDIRTDMRGLAAAKRRRGEFANNIRLTGSYIEESGDAHGDPSDRSTAFRWGLNFRFREEVPDVRVASSYFADVLYEE